MAIITISRGSYSGGKNLAESLAHSLNYRCVDRDTLIERASVHGPSPNDLLAAFELPPTTQHYTVNHRKYVYLALMQEAIADELISGNAIYHGLVGHLLLPIGIPVLRIRVIAPMEYRIGIVQERNKCDRTQAIAQIEKSDEHRRKWTRYIYGVNWEDPSHYDMVLNLEQIKAEQACRFLCELVKDNGFKFNEDQNSIMANFTLSAQVRAALARDPLTSNLEVEVECKAGEIIIKGVLCEQTEEIQRIASKIRGINKIKLVDSENSSK
jgi:cytidylate kinase